MTPGEIGDPLDAVGDANRRAPATELPTMYGELAPWFHLLTSPADYEEEAEHLLSLLRDVVDVPLVTALELGSGGGNLASHLGRSLTMTLSDVSAPMIALSRTINPAMEHLVADLRTLRVERTFDAVIIHDAIMYMTTEDDLRAAFETAFVHLRGGGVAAFLPDCVKESFVPATDHGGHDEHPDGTGRGLRYLEWTTDPDPADSTYQVDYAYLLREADGRHRVVQDRHVEGLFPRATWLRLLADVGFEARVSVDPWARDVFVGRRPVLPGDPDGPVTGR